MFKNLFSKYLKPAEKEKPMGTPADTLVAQHPDRTSQLLGPVYDYLKPMMPYSQVPQDLYMAVFYPVARKWPSNQEFSPAVRKVNPGIVKVQDYVDKVEAASKRFRPVLSAAEQNALNVTSKKLGVTADSLYKLVNFESGWDPQAVNKYTGARGLIQFMPKTAAGMGFAAAMSILPLLVVGGVVYFYLHRRGII